jgi:cytochrome bd-type quinol oxidase subunit 2
MSDAPKKMVIGSMVVAVLVGIAAVSDLIVGFPFSGTEHTRMMDILFIVCAGIVGYLAWDAYKDLR